MDDDDKYRLLLEYNKFLSDQSNNVLNKKILNTLLNKTHLFVSGKKLTKHIVRHYVVV